MTKEEPARSADDVECASLAFRRFAGMLRSIRRAEPLVGEIGPVEIAGSLEETGGGSGLESDVFALECGERTFEEDSGDSNAEAAQSAFADSPGKNKVYSRCSTI